MTGVVRRALTLVAPVALVVGLTSPAGATAKRTPTTLSQQQKAEKAQINAQIQSLRSQVDEVSNEEADLLGKIDEVQSRRADLDARVASLDRQISTQQGAVDDAEAKLNELQGEFVRAQTKLQISEGQVASAHQELRDRAVAAYIGNPQAAAAGAMFRAQDMHELVTSVSYFESIVQAQRRSLGRYTVLRDGVEALRLSLDKTKNDAKAERDVIVGKQADLEATRQAQDDVRQQVAADEKQKQTLLDEVQSRKSEFEAQIATLRAQSDAIGGVLRGVQSGQGPAPSGHGVLSSPIPGAPITSTFGPRMHPIFHVIRMHTGVDFGASAGIPIEAAADGVVVSAGPLGGYGNATVIDHGNSLATLYAHQSAINVTAGQRVIRGEVIGLVGCTGFCTGPHLHFEVRVNGTPVDPLPYL